HINLTDAEENKLTLLNSAVKGSYQTHSNNKTHSYYHYPIVQLLIEQKVDATIPDIDGNTPLHWAARRFVNSSIINKLLEFDNTTINTKNNEGNTPLHKAVSVKFDKEDVYCDTISLLLQYKADINAQNNKLETPLHLAIKRKRKKVAAFLIANKA